MVGDPWRAGFTLDTSFFLWGGGGAEVVVVVVRSLSKGVTPRGWFVSEVLGRPEDGTRDPDRFPISQDFWGGWKGGSRSRIARGGFGSSSCSPPVGR